MEIGSLVICTVGGGWQCKYTKEIQPGPGKDEITTVSAIDPEDGGLSFLEYPLINNRGELFCYPRIYFKEIQPPLDIKIESLIEEEITT